MCNENKSSNYMYYYLQVAPSILVNHVGQVIHVVLYLQELQLGRDGQGDPGDPINTQILKLS